MKLYNSQSLPRALSLFTFLFLSLSAKAQDATSFLNETYRQISSIGSLLYKVVIGVLCLIAIVSLITVAIRLYNNDQGGASKAIGWCGTMLFCIIAAVVLKNFMGL